MLHIALTILQCIGFLLLCIVLVVLVLTLLVLFVPVRYRGRLQYVAEADAKLTVSWLLHVVHVSVVFQDGRQAVSVRVFGIRINGKWRAKFRTWFRRGDKRADDVSDAQPADLCEEPESAGEDSERPDSAESRVGETVSETAEDHGSQSRNNWYHRFRDWWIYLKTKILHFCSALRHIWASYQCMADRVAAFAEWWEREETQKSYAFVKSKAAALLREILPARGEARLRYGTGDPATTGYITAVLGVLYSMCHGNLYAEPDFLEPVFEGSLWFKGRIRIYRVLYLAAVLYFDRTLRKTIRSLEF